MYPLLPSSVLPCSAANSALHRFLKPLIFIADLVAGGTGLAAEQSASANQAKSALLERGRYLAERVGMCADCHSPRNEKGEFIREQWFRGATLGFAPTIPMPVWAPAAPPIAGLAQMTEAEAVNFFMNGLRPDGSRSRPPMPEYRLDKADATALVAYLKSLGTP